MTNEVQEVPISSVEFVQSRVDNDLEVVKDYAELMMRGVDFPPLDAIFDGETYWVWDGTHRLLAKKKLEAGTVFVKAKRGRLREARWLALGANQTHGLRRTNADKGRAVCEAIKMQKGKDAEEADGEIARHVGVCIKTVQNYRRKLEEEDRRNGKADSQPASKKIRGKDGRIRIFKPKLGKIPKTDQDKDDEEEVLQKLLTEEADFPERNGAAEHATSVQIRKREKEDIIAYLQTCPKDTWLAALNEVLEHPKKYKSAMTLLSGLSELSDKARECLVNSWPD